MNTTQQRRVRIVHDPDPINPRKDYDNLGTMLCWHRRYTLGDEQPKENPTHAINRLAEEACPRLAQIVENWEGVSWEWLRDNTPNMTFEQRQQAIGAHLRELTNAVLDKYFVILPLYLFDHSGITMRCRPFSCPWDSGQVGYLVCSLEDARKNFMLDQGADWNTCVPWDSTGGEVKTTKSLREATVAVLEAEVELYDQYLRGDVFGFVVEECETCECCGHTKWKELDSCFGFLGNDMTTNGILDQLAYDSELVEMAKQADIE